MAKHLTIITGASRGMGLAIAQQLLDEGHDLLCISRKTNDALQQHAAKAGVSCEQWPHDLAHMSGQPILYADLEDEAGIYAVRLEGAAYRKSRDMLKLREPLLVRGLVESHPPAPPVLVAEIVQRCA